MASIWDQAKAFVPGVQQIFQNAGYNQQQGNRSVVSGLLPRALGGTGLVSPAGASSGSTTNYTPPPSNPPTNNKTSTTGGSTGGSTGGQILGAQTYSDQANQDNQNQTNRELDVINAEYEQEMSRLGGLEGNVRDQYNTVKGQTEQYFPEFQKTAQAQQAGDIASLDETGNIRKQESASAMSKARSLLAELQRRQMAYMSATGNYSSSTADAFGEQFGRQAYSQLSDVQGQRDTALRQVEAEKQKVNNFYSEKITTAKQNYDKQLSSLNQQFLGQLDSINSAKGAAASAKRQATVDTWRNYTQAKLDLSNQLFQYKTQYDQWKQQMDSSLAQKAVVGDVSSVNPNYTNTESMVSGVGTAPASATSNRSGQTLNQTLTYEDLQKMMSQVGK